jgi:hypothetical protein
MVFFPAAASCFWISSFFRSSRISLNLAACSKRVSETRPRIQYGAVWVHLPSSFSL